MSSDVSRRNAGDHNVYQEVDCGAARQLLELDTRYTSALVNQLQTIDEVLANGCLIFYLTSIEILGD